MTERPEAHKNKLSKFVRQQQELNLATNDNRWRGTHVECGMNACIVCQLVVMSAMYAIVSGISFSRIMLHSAVQRLDAGSLSCLTFPRKGKADMIYC
jgi:hypothetical protein